MPRALVLSPRSGEVTGLLAGLFGAELQIESGPTDFTGAAKELRHQRCDLVFLDLCGLSVQDHAFVNPLCHEARPAAVIAIVAGHAPEQFRLALQSNCDDILLDPFDLAHVRLTVRSRLKSLRDGSHETASLDALAIFLKGISHEILNPLTSISGIAQMLRLESEDNEEQSQRMGTLLENVARIQNTLRELEHFVRTRKPQRKSLNLVELLKAVRQKLAAEPHPIELYVESQSIPPILGDWEQLVVAIAHIVRFSSRPPEDRPVSAQLRPDGGQVELEILSTAPVSLPENPEKLFYPYQESPRSRSPGNLWLSAAFGIVRSHHGTLRIEQAEGGLARFRAHLPARPVDRSEPA